MEERTIHLRIKVKSLVEEARIIRHEAKKEKGMVKWGLNQHRKTVVRDHARHNLLAYGILVGVPYGRMEHRCREKPNFSRVETLARRFGATQKDVTAWIEEAKDYLDPPKEKVA